MKVLVTGASGYIGSRLVQLLREENYEVVAWEGRLLGDWQPPPSVNAVVHLAGGGGPVECAKDPVETVRTNVLGTLRIVRATRNATVCILASSIYVYPTAETLLTEFAPTAPDTLYGAVKEAAEHVWEGISLRFAHVYGPSPKQLDSVMDRFARAAVQGEKLDVFDACKRIQYVHIDDACRAILLALKEGTSWTKLNIGGESISVRELAEKSIEAGARGALPPPCAVFRPSRHMDCSMAKYVLGWEPTIPLAEGISTFIESVR